MWRVSAHECWWLWRTETSGSPGAGVTGGHEPPFEFWRANLGSLWDQQMLLICWVTAVAPRWNFQLAWFGASNHSCRECVCFTSGSLSKGHHSQPSSPSSSSHLLPTPSSMLLADPWDGGLVQMSHLWLSTPRYSPSAVWPDLSFSVNHCPPQEEGASPKAETCPALWMET